MRCKILSKTNRAFFIHGVAIKPFSRVFIDQVPAKPLLNFFDYYAIDGEGKETKLTEANKMRFIDPVHQDYSKQPEAKAIVDTIPVEQEDDCICRYCGKVLKSAGGRASHERSCKNNPDNME